MARDLTRRNDPFDWIDDMRRTFEGYLVRERRSTSFARSFPLPKGVKADKIDATFKDWVLTVVMPKSEDQAGRKINVKKA